MTPEEFVFDLPLYTTVHISDSTIWKDFHSRVRIEGYNSFRGVDSTFELAYPLDSRFSSQKGVTSLRFDCLRYNDSICVMIVYDLEKDTLMKAGQFPSVADIHIAQVKKYRTVLGEDYIRDFTKAIGLAANGVGTGAFVYLRRVFEHLIFEIGDKLIKKGEIDKTQFESSKMDNKLKMLSGYLPEVIMENKSLYGVLSAGIHALSEDVCLQYFSAVRTVIELILDDIENTRQLVEKKKKAKRELDAISSEVKKETKH